MGAALERRRGLRERWPTRIMFIAGLPKSGTTWLAQLLAEVPGFRPRPVWDPHRCLEEHEVCDSVFESVEPYPHSVLKFHTQASDQSLVVIRRHGIKTVVMHRDLRDQCVSRYFHVLADTDHRHHALYLEWSKERALEHCADIALGEYREWIEGWQRVIDADPEHFHLVRYEDLRADPEAALQGVLQFYDIDLDRDACADIVRAVQGRTRFGLRAEDIQRGKSTAREGKVGGWQEHLPAALAERFDAQAGDLAGQRRRRTND